MKITKIVLGSLCASLLAGCQSVTHLTPAQNYSAQQTCDRVKRQMTYNAVNNNVEASFLTRGQTKALREEYKRNHCDQVA